MSIFVRSILFICALMIVGLLVVAIGAGVYASRVLHTLDGTYAHASLKDRVTVTRDDWGVPHIRAKHATDAYFAYGFSVAQDRLFQLEILRRLGRGELAEILGETALPLDKVSRTLMWSKTAEKLLADESQLDPEFLAMLDAFITGLNYYVESQPLPIEFEILGIEPTPFTKVDSLSLFGYMSYGFAEGLKSDSAFAIAKARNPDLDVNLLFPGYSKQQPVTVMEGLDPKLTRGLIPEKQHSTADGALHAGLEDLALVLAEVEEALDLFGGFEGSNSWVLGPSRSESGGAILANDPHIGFSNPAVWYECHIKYGDYENYGVHLPLIPFPIIAHNKHKAWSMTMFENDDVDLYRETFSDDGSQVMYRTSWVSPKRWTETIKVKDAEDVQHPVTVTPHGPLVTELMPGYDGPPVSMWWMFHKMGPGSLEAFYRLGKAKTLPQTRAAVAMIEAPGLNVSYADKDGNIAWWAAAKIPIRRDHVNSKDILDGSSGKDEPIGYVDFNDNPQLVNPPSGVIVTSNNMSTLGPVGPIPQLEGYWQPSDRAGRILALLNRKKAWSLRDLRRVQCDTMLVSGPSTTNALLGALEGQRDALSTTERAALEAFDEWDRQHDVDSIGATIYEHVYAAVLERLAMDEFGEAAFDSYLSCADSTNLMSYVVHEKFSPLWDNVQTEREETREEIVLAGFKDAVAQMRGELGNDVSTWRWGRVHTVEYGHILGNVKPLNTLWNIGPFETQGTAESVAKMQWGDDGFKVEHGASMRLLIDYAAYGTADGIHFILPTGNSGDMMSPHFDDQAAMYVAGKYRPLRISGADIEQFAEHRIVLAPQ